VTWTAAAVAAGIVLWAVGLAALLRRHAVQRSPTLTLTAHDAQDEGRGPEQARSSVGLPAQARAPSRLLRATAVLAPVLVTFIGLVASGVYIALSLWGAAIGHTGMDARERALPGSRVIYCASLALAVGLRALLERRAYASPPRGPEPAELIRARRRSRWVAAWLAALLVAPAWSLFSASSEGLTWRGWSWWGLLVSAVLLCMAAGWGLKVAASSAISARARIGGVMTALAAAAAVSWIATDSIRMGPMNLSPSVLEHDVLGVWRCRSGDLDLRPDHTFGLSGQEPWAGHWRIQSSGLFLWDSQNRTEYWHAVTSWQELVLLRGWTRPGVQMPPGCRTGGGR
jgi:hypothetical protein